MSAIGQLNESPLHAALKQHCAAPGDQLEAELDGYVVDILRGDQVIEIQTGSFAKLGTKLRALLESYRVRVVYPVPRERWIVKLPERAGQRPVRRRSPKRTPDAALFEELVSFPDLLAHPGVEIELMAVSEEQVRRFGGPRRRRRWQRHGGWTVVERRLLDVLEERRIACPRDLARFVPDDLAEPFTTAELAPALGTPRSLAQKAAYCLHGCGALERVGHRGRAHLYARVAQS